MPVDVGPMAGVRRLCTNDPDMIGDTIPEIRRPLISLPAHPAPMVSGPGPGWCRRRQYQALLCHYRQRGYALTFVRGRIADGGAGRPDVTCRRASLVARRCSMAESVRSAWATAAGQDPNVSFALGSSPGESAGLQRQADEPAPDSRDLLDRVGLRLGQAVTTWAVARSASWTCWPSGSRRPARIVGLDADPAHTAMATEFAAGRGLSGVQIMTVITGSSRAVSAGSSDPVPPG
jgi:hypothetical protein